MVHVKQQKRDKGIINGNGCISNVAMLCQIKTSSKMNKGMQSKAIRSRKVRMRKEQVRTGVHFAPSQISEEMIAYKPRAHKNVSS